MPTDGYAICNKCLQDAPLTHVYATTEYSDVPKRLIHALKFARARAAVQCVAQYMDEHVPLLTPGTVICPVPTAHARIRSRGYDQAALIAKAFASYRGLHYQELLIRSTHVRQVGANRLSREQQMQHAFRIKQGAISVKAPILLIDDVITTGSTLRSAAHTLQACNGSSICAAVFARA
jgi:ComF family protein